MTRFTIRRFAARFLISIAYFICMLQWLWLAVIGMPPLIESGVLDGLLSQAKQPEQPSQSTGELPQPVMIIIGIITLVMIVVTIVILMRLPKAVVNTGQTITQVATKVVVPTILHHKKVSAKKRRVISRRVMLGVQIGFCLLPALLIIFLPVPKDLPIDGLRLVTVILLVPSLLGFAVGWLIEPPASKKRTI